MKSFKSFLTEGNMANIDATSIELEDLINCYKNAGNLVPRNEMKFFVSSKYAGWNKTSKSHMYWVLMEDDGNSNDEYYISKFFVSLGEDGKLHADSSGRPDFDGTEGEMQKKFQDL